MKRPGKGKPPTQTIMMGEPCRCTSPQWRTPSEEVTTSSFKSFFSLGLDPERILDLSLLRWTLYQLCSRVQFYDSYTGFLNGIKQWYLIVGLWQLCKVWCPLWKQVYITVMSCLDYNYQSDSVRADKHGKIDLIPHTTFQSAFDHHVFKRLPALWVPWLTHTGFGIVPNNDFIKVCPIIQLQTS